MSLTPCVPGWAASGAPGGSGARLAAVRRADGEEPVHVLYCGRRWTGLTRAHMRRVPGSLPAAVFAAGSQLVGGATVQLVDGAWEWRVADAGAPPEAMHAVVRFLCTGALPPEWRERPGLRALARRWRLTPLE